MNELLYGSNIAEDLIVNPYIELESIGEDAEHTVTRIDRYSGKFHTITTYFFEDGSMAVLNGARVLYYTGKK